MKYAITSNKLIIDNRDFFQVKALKDFGDVKAGQLGGYIQSSENLSQEGNCWITRDVVLMDDARVEDNAFITGDSVVRNKGRVSGYVRASNVTVCDNAIIEGTCDVIGGHHDYDSILIKDNAIVRSDLHGSFVICGNAIIGSALNSTADLWIGFDTDDENAVMVYPAPHGTEYDYDTAIVASTTKDQWCFRGDNDVVEITSREIDSLLPELVGPKFATYMKHLRDAHHSVYDIELFEDDFE